MGGGAGLQHRHFSVKMYVKTKELDPVGGHMPAAPPGSANAEALLNCLVPTGACDIWFLIKLVKQS